MISSPLKKSKYILQDIFKNIKRIKIMKQLFTSLILFASISGIAQQKSTKEVRGDKYAFVYSFDKAIDSYTRSRKLTMDGQRHLASSYHNINQDTKAEPVYAKIVSAPHGVLPEDHYNYAMVLKANGKYAEANKSMDKFKELKPGDICVKSYSANSNGLTYLLKDDGKYKVEHLNLNTDAEDFGTCFYKNKIVFSSSRTISKEKNYNWNGKPFLDIYMSEVDGNQLKTPESFGKTFNGKLHDGTAAFNKDGTYIAYTTNNVKLNKKDRIVNLEIFFSNYKDNKWSVPEAFELNNKDYGVGQPFLTADGNTMYFASNMPGGYGGADIYRVKKNNKGEWQKAENLGNKINTERDELFPFFEENNEILLFTSNGQYGLGGLDIFMCATNGPQFGRVYNAGIPLNTQYDDFAVIVNGKTDKGYFSSNRVGGSGDDDIYSVDFLKGLNAGKKIKGIAKDINGNRLAKTFITLFNNNGTVIDTVTTNETAAYIFLVESNEKFKLSGTKESYNEGDTFTDTYGKEFIVTADVTLSVPLKKEEIIAQKIVVGADLGKILDLKPIYFDLNKYDIRPDAEVELDKIIKVMNDHPTIIVELGSHTDCRNTKKYNQKLSEKRAKASAAYVQRGITSIERIYGKGYGETKLVNGCACEGKVVSRCSEEDHQNNRRTEFIIVKK
jgi:outer membrane protein OmpA-like peptidoglycan-associated protein